MQDYSFQEKKTPGDKWKKMRVYYITWDDIISGLALLNCRQSPLQGCPVGLSQPSKTAPHPVLQGFPGAGRGSALRRLCSSAKWHIFGAKRGQHSQRGKLPAEGALLADLRTASSLCCWHPGWPATPCSGEATWALRASLPLTQGDRHSSTWTAAPRKAAIQSPARL